LKLNFPNDNVGNLDSILYKNILVKAVRDLFGQVGISSYEFDVIEYWEFESTGIIRVNSIGFVAIWSAFTLLSQYDNMNCNILIKRTASNLVAFGTNELHIY